MLAGVRSTFKGKVIGEDLTKWPDQLDFSAELSKVRAAKPDAVFVFYPGAAGVQFLNQYAQAGLQGPDPALHRLHHRLAVAAAAEGPRARRARRPAVGQRPAERRQQEVRRRLPQASTRPIRRSTARRPMTPSILIDSAVTAVKGDLTKKDGMRNEMRKANYTSVRGPVQVRQQPLPDPEFLSAGRGEGRRGQPHAEDRRDHRQGQPGPLPHASAR